MDLSPYYLTDKHYLCLFNASEAKVAHIITLLPIERAAVESLLGHGLARAGNSPEGLQLETAPLLHCLFITPSRS